MPGAQQLAQVLSSEFGATQHPTQENAFVVENCAFHAPRLANDHISILSFNDTPLADGLIQALMDHPELIPDEVLLRGTQEQDQILDATLGELRRGSTRP